MTNGKARALTRKTPTGPKTAPEQPIRPSAETVLARFIAAWRILDWDAMAGLCQLSWLDHNDDHITALKGLFQFKPQEVEVLGAEDYDGVVYAARLRIKAAIARGVVQERTVEARLICELGPLHPSRDGSWGVNPLSLYRVVT